MQQLHEIELEDAKQRLRGSGREPEDFDFAIAFLDPDPDGAGMFTVRYEVGVTNRKSRKGRYFIGGIGLAWVDDFTLALRAGDFD